MPSENPAIDFFGSGLFLTLATEKPKSGKNRKVKLIFLHELKPRLFPISNLDNPRIGITGYIRADSRQKLKE